MSRVEVTQETTPLSDGILKTDLPIDGTLQVVKDQLNNSSTLQISNTTTKVNSTLTVAERVNVESDSTVTTQTSSVIRASTTDSNLVIAPNGSGALIADIPDGLVSGGNARGAYAVDLQLLRTGANQVASGNYSFAQGQKNIASNSFCVAIGDSNSATGSYSVVIGGNSSNSGGTSIVLGHNNNNSSNFSAIGGGQSNTTSTGTHATVVGGQSNTASGAHSVAGGDRNNATGRQSVSFGEVNTSSGEKGTTLGSANTASGFASGAFGFGNSASSTMCFAFGQNNNTNGNYSTCIGSTNQASGQYCLATGYQSKGYLLSQFSSASNAFSANGDAQQSLLTARREASLLTSAITVLSLDGTGLTNLIIPNSNNRAWNVQVNWVAVVTGITGTATGISVGDVITSIDLLAFKRVAGTSSASSHTSTATKTMVTSPAQYVGCSIAYTAGASQEMALTFTGPTFAGGGSVVMRVVARIELAEVAWL